MNRNGSAQLDELALEGEKRYTNQQPPGYKDAKKDADGDQYRRYGDLIVWKQLLDEAKTKNVPVVFITDDNKEDWWLVQSGRTIGPRTELRDEFFTFAGNNFWMYTVDRFIEEAGRARNANVSREVIEEIKQVSFDAKEDKTFSYASYQLKAITKEMMLDKLEASEKWAQDNHRDFIGLTSFVKNYLGSMGYDYSISFDLIRQLEEDGVIEVYDQYTPGYDRPTKAIRRNNVDGYSNRPLKDLRSMMDSNQDT